MEVDCCQVDLETDFFFQVNLEVDLEVNSEVD